MWRISSGLTGKVSSGCHIFSPIERRLIRNYCVGWNKALAREYFPQLQGELFACDDDDRPTAPEVIPGDVLAEIVAALFAGHAEGQQRTVAGRRRLAVREA